MKILVYIEHFQCDASIRQLRIVAAEGGQRRQDAACGVADEADAAVAQQHVGAAGVETPGMIGVPNRRIARSLFLGTMLADFSILVPFMTIHYIGRTNFTETATAPTIPDDVKAELREALDDLANGIRRPAKMQAACERMDRMREENRRLFGEQNIALELIRETRDQ